MYLMTENRKVALIPVLVSVVNILKYLKDNGKADHDELLKISKSKRRTYYRALEALKEANIIIKGDDGRFYWYEFIQTRSYKSEFEAREALNHSKNVVKGLRYLIMENKWGVEQEDNEADERYSEYAKIHMRNGYPDIFDYYNKSERVREERLKLENRVKEKIYARIQPSHQILFPEHLARLIIEDIKEMLIGREPAYLKGLIIEGEEVKSIGYILAKKESFNELNNFIVVNENDKENRNDCGEMLKLGTEYYQLKEKLRGGIDMIIMQVTNGTPLHGTCELCPKIIIKNKEDK